jgi:uncharacterized protein YggU (UPF0235/DUF167 family)
MTRGAPAQLPALPEWLRTGTDFVTIKLHARPGAPRPGIIRVNHRGIVAGLRSHAEKGKANDELAEMVAKLAGVPRAAIAIIQGARARDKVVRVATANPIQTARRLAQLALRDRD